MNAGIVLKMGSARVWLHTTITYHDRTRRETGPRDFCGPDGGRARRPLCCLAIRNEFARPGPERSFNHRMQLCQLPFRLTVEPISRLGRLFSVRHGLCGSASFSASACGISGRSEKPDAIDASPRVIGGCFVSSHATVSVLATSRPAMPRDKSSLP